MACFPADGNQLSCLRLLFQGLTPFFHRWVWDALITTDKHQSPLTASSPPFNITLIFHLWLLIQPFTINKRSVNVAIIAPSPRLDYLWHPGFAVGVKETVGRQYWSLSDLSLPATPISSAIRSLATSIYACKEKGVAEAPAHPAQSGSSTLQGIKEQRDSSVTTTGTAGGFVWVTAPLWMLLGLKR